MISVVEILLEEFILTALLHGKFITLWRIVKVYELKG
jgi:hypothetical protein